jgi:hypothetical protein
MNTFCSTKERTIQKNLEGGSNVATPKGNTEPICISLRKPKQFSYACAILDNWNDGNDFRVIEVSDVLKSISFCYDRHLLILKTKIYDRSITPMKIATRH